MVYFYVNIAQMSKTYYAHPADIYTCIICKHIIVKYKYSYYGGSHPTYFTVYAAAALRISICLKF